MPPDEPPQSSRPGRAPIRDPHLIPVVRHDADLPAVALERLQPDALRARLARVDDWQAPIVGDGARADWFGDRPATAASVLVPLVQRPGELHVLLTRRTDHLHDHAGQISFPGGRAEPTDADAVATALREAEEEVGLSHGVVEVLGHLPTYTTVTRFVVTPVVGLVKPDYVLALDTFEVAEAFEVPLPYLMNPAHHQHHEFEFGGARRHFLSMPWRPGHGDPREYFIWGATAAMLRNLYHLLSE
ncbi:CoA pyrophosphatase [Ideonella sp.]|uniref:CoA pyrophosphatase n=1 Tax=Ideonella sp. TaxID=1929293 RepID=UPI002B474BCA|nr:CoA pyrophosphatase [Ideonella sp.]HJV67621.1 CoA pyrophosphatase [Ideonella sp.]